MVMMRTDQTVSTEKHTTEQTIQKDTESKRPIAKDQLGTGNIQRPVWSCLQ